LDGPSVTSAIVTMAGQLGQTVGANGELATLCDKLYEQLAALRPGLTLVIFQYDQRLDALFARHASGPHSNAIKDLTIGVGLRLTGWVAAHRSTIVNSEAALDLGNLTVELRPMPQFCVSTHMALGTELVGALTAYSTSDQPFTVNEVALFKMLAGLLGPIAHNDRAARPRRNEERPDRLRRFALASSATHISGAINARSTQVMAPAPVQAAARTDRVAEWTTPDAKYTFQP